MFVLQPAKLLQDFKRPSPWPSLPPLPCRQHREKLLQLARALQHCCCEAADVVQQQHSTPIGQALESLRGVEDAYAALFLEARERAASAAGSTGVELSESHVAFTMLLSLLFTLCTRVRQRQGRPALAGGVDVWGCSSRDGFFPRR